MATNSKPPASSSAIASYLKNVQDNMDPAAQAVTEYFGKPKSQRESIAELTQQMTASDKRAIKNVDPSFWDDVDSINDAGRKAITANLPDYVSKKIRAIAARIESANTAAMSKVKRNRLTKASLMGAKRVGFNKQMIQQKQPLNASDTLALTIRTILRDKQAQQSAGIEQAEVGAQITPDTQGT